MNSERNYSKLEEEMSQRKANHMLKLTPSDRLKFALNLCDTCLKLRKSYVRTRVKTERSIT